MILAGIDIMSALTDWLLNEGELGLRLAVAVCLGGLIGVERGASGHSAGLRTQMLVALGSCLVMIVSLHFAEVFGDYGGSIRIDPARTAYGVMTGVGFLGAGTIMRWGKDIHGLTTAASLWCTAAVGLAAGFGMYAMALSATLLTLVILVVVRWVDGRLPHPVDRELSVSFSGDPTAGDKAVVVVLDSRNITYAKTGVTIDHAADVTTVEYLIKIRQTANPSTLVDALRSGAGVKRIKLH